jgi:mono/diheme cytochrome c family protein
VANFLFRIAGAATLDPRTYEDVEADQTATPQALAVIILASLAAGIGASGWRSEVASVLTLSAFVATMALLAWICWALVTFEIGSRLLAESQTRTDVGELLRTLGFSAAPGLFLVFGAFPGLTTPVFVITSVWLLAAMVIALRQALDYTSVLRALAVCSLGWLLALGFIIVFGLLSGPALSAQTKPAQTPQLPPAAPVYDGAQLFRNHCATCHGATGRGDGPMSKVLRKPPADLTKFAIKNGGVFPSERVRRIIDGRDVPSHGDRDMPVWGITLRTSRDDGGYDSIEARIDALVRYIQSLQERTAQ